LKTEKSLSQKVIIGGAWIFALRIAERIMGFLKIIILARLLAPKDFGLFGIALLTLSTLETFSNTGFQNALIQKKDSIRDYLNTVWTISTLRGIVLYLIVFFIAPYVAIFFNNPESGIIIRIVGLTIIFRGVLNVGTIYFQKELEFNKQFVLQFISSSIEFIIAITCAILLKSFWALVIGQLCGSLTFLITSYIIHPYRPRFKLELEKTKELFKYGKWVFGSSILVFLITHGDDAFVGRFLGVTMLGFYQMAYRISNIPTTEFTSMLSSVMFPAYSKIQSDLIKLNKVFLQVLEFTTLFAFFISIIILTFSYDFTVLFLKEKWLPIVPALKILCIFGLIRSISATTGPVLMAIGKPNIILFINSIKLMLIIILIYPLTKNFGIEGTSISITLPMIIEQLFLWKIVSRHISQFSIRKVINKYIAPAVGSLITYMGVHIIKSAFRLDNTYTIYYLLIFIFVGTVIYLSTVVLIRLIQGLSIIPKLTESK